MSSFSPVQAIRLLRPHQWTKNAFVLTGLVFGHAWHDPSLLAKSVLATAAFCLISSGAYVLNDLVDRERDRLHSSKKDRPLASGRISVSAAVSMIVVLTAAGAWLGSAASPVVLACLAGYGAISVAYSLSLKHVVILDVFAIAAGFMLRIFAGTWGIGISPSQWLLLCGLMITLLLGFTKRRAELMSVGNPGSAQPDGTTHRKTLAGYTPALLDKMVGVSAACVILSYSLYTMSPETIRFHRTEKLIYTVPFIVYGVFRHIYLLHARRQGEDFAKDLVRDPHLLLTVAGWLALTIWIIA